MGSMMTKTAKFTVEVEYDEGSTDPTWIAYALNKLMEEATTTPGALDKDSGCDLSLVNLGVSVIEED